MGFADDAGEVALGARRPWLIDRVGFRISLVTGTKGGLLQEGISGEGARKDDWGVADTVGYCIEPTLGEDAARYGVTKPFMAGMLCK